MPEKAKLNADPHSKPLHNPARLPSFGTRALAVALLAAAGGCASAPAEPVKAIPAPSPESVFDAQKKEIETQNVHGGRVHLKSSHIFPTKDGRCLREDFDHRTGLSSLSIDGKPVSEAEFQEAIQKDDKAPGVAFFPTPIAKPEVSTKPRDEAPGTFRHHQTSVTRNGSSQIFTEDVEDGYARYSINSLPVDKKTYQDALEKLEKMEAAEKKLQEAEKRARITALQNKLEVLQQQLEACKKLPPSFEKDSKMSSLQFEIESVKSSIQFAQY